MEAVMGSGYWPLKYTDTNPPSNYIRAYTVIDIW